MIQGRDLKEMPPGEVEKKIALAIKDKNLKDFRYNSQGEFFSDELRGIVVSDALRKLENPYGVLKFKPDRKHSTYEVNQEGLDRFISDYCKA